MYAESNSRDTGWWMSLVTAPETMSYLFQLKLNKAVIFDGAMGVVLDPHQHLRSTLNVRTSASPHSMVPLTQRDRYVKKGGCLLTG